VNVPLASRFGGLAGFAIGHVGVPPTDRWCANETLVSAIRLYAQIRARRLNDTPNRLSSLSPATSIGLAA
jgi:hypothetical protein